jgi:[phosphatase 2A protein]-leucine-carboxy methyltransferase
MSDEAIQTTNDDATQSKKYAVDKGYWTDNYISYFCPLVDRKTPEICRGYYARVKSIHSLLTKFLKLTSCDCQVINLGAGYDSLYWVLNEKGLRPKLFIDVDFTEVTSRKCYLIKTKHQLLDVVKGTDGSFELRGDELWSKHYHVMSCDMRKIDQFSSKLIAHGVDIKLVH